MRGNIADRIIPNVISRHVRAIENVTRDSGLGSEERDREKKREGKRGRLPSTCAPPLWEGGGGRIGK